MEGQLFTLLPPARPRWKSFLVGWSVNALSLAGVLFLGARVRHEFVSRERFRATDLVSYVSLTLPQQQPFTLPAVNRPQPLQHTDLAPKIEPPEQSTPAVQALVVTPQVRSVREHKAPEPDPAAPQLKVEGKMPAIPSAPTAQIVAVGTFSAKSPIEASAKPVGTVQAGGFGDVNGVPALQHRGVANISSKGSFDLPAGSGHGNGIPATSSGVVMQSGFANPVTTAAVKSPAIVKPSSGANTPVEITFKPKPDYTEAGRKQKINGEVELQVLFSADGRVRVMRVVQRLGYGLDEQAVKAAEQIKFKPALHEGQPIDTTALVHIIFELIS